MAPGSHSDVVDLEEVDEESITDKIIKEKVWSLKSAFMSQHFAEVEGFLVSMNQKLELESKSWKERAQIERSERLKAENELKERIRECLQLKKEQDRFNELMMSSGEDKRIIRALGEEICELKCAKLKAENAVDTYKSKFEELWMRVFLLEKDLMMLKSDEPENNVRVSKGVPEKTIVLDENAISGENFVTVRTEVVCSGSNVDIAAKVNDGPRPDPPESTSGVVGAPGLVSGKDLGEKVVSENGKGDERIGNVKTETGVLDNNENMILWATGGSRSNLPENGEENIPASGGLTTQSQEIIKIVDGDGDSSSSATLIRKKLAKQEFQHEAGISVEVVNNETKLLKRKRTSCSNSKDDVGGCNVQRATKSPLLIPSPESVPVNHCAATTMLSGSNDRRNISSPSRQAPTNLRQCEEKIRIGQNSRIQESELVLLGSGGSDSEESSSFSDSEEFDFSIDFSSMTKPVQANINSIKWKSEAEMVAAIEQDAELHSRAVCALFGQQVAVEKSSNFHSTFPNGGFDKVDAARGAALAEFLINGDPQGKLQILELIKYDPEGFNDCKRLVIKYSKQLFEMYRQKGDRLFFN
ncbi:keratin, type cytoskeletal [Salix suchowensis]|nr:keratin, type cytoskeletal [Salix suchowensis]